MTLLTARARVVRAAKALLDTYQFDGQVSRVKLANLLLRTRQLLALEKTKQRAIQAGKKAGRTRRRNVALVQSIRVVYP